MTSESKIWEKRAISDSEMFELSGSAGDILIRSYEQIWKSHKELIELANENQELILGTGMVMNI